METEDVKVAEVAADDIVPTAAEVVGAKEVATAEVEAPANRVVAVGSKGSDLIMSRGPDDFKFTVVTGPMFSGKSTVLYNTIYKHQNILKQNIFVVGYKYDTRSGYFLRTHSGLKIGYSCFLSNLLELLVVQTDQSLLLSNAYKKFLNADLVVIDEAHFFDDLFEFIQMINRPPYSKQNIMIGGLYSDYNAVPFQNMVKVIPFATKVKFMHALCTECRDGTKATLTKMICPTITTIPTTTTAAVNQPTATLNQPTATTSVNKLPTATTSPTATLNQPTAVKLVGGAETYIPVCWKHFA